VTLRLMPRAMKLFLAEGTGATIKIVPGENAVLLEQLRVGDLDLVVGGQRRLKKWRVFLRASLFGKGGVLRTLRSSAAVPRSDLFRAQWLMPTRASIIRPFV